MLLSGVMVKMALYALARTVSIFYPPWPQVTIFLVALGVFTMLFGITLAFTRNDLKGLLGHSSVSQIGCVLAGVGSYLGCYGDLFHLLNHTLCKSLLFMSVGAVIWSTGARRISELGGLRTRMPVTSVCFFLGALAIAGFPPLHGFWSKLTVYLALARAGLWWAAIAAIVASILTMVVMSRAASRVFWGKCKAADAYSSNVKEVPARMWGSKGDPGNIVRSDRNRSSTSVSVAERGESVGDSERLTIRIILYCHLSESILRIRRRPSETSPTRAKAALMGHTSEHLQPQAWLNTGVVKRHPCDPLRFEIARSFCSVAGIPSGCITEENSHPPVGPMPPALNLILHFTQSYLTHPLC